MPRKNKFFAFIIFSAIIAFTYSACSQNKDRPPKAQAKKKNLRDSSAKSSEFIYDAHEKRNPFVPLVSADGRILEPQASKKTAGEVYIEGIIYDAAGSSYAVINGEIVKAGDNVGNYQVIRIEPQKIIFLQEGKELAIELKKED